jgi:uncharacterized protein (TIGR02145 family)
MKSIILLCALLVACSSSDPAPSTTPPASTAIKDKDGNVYTTITIGGQVWLKQNLKTRHFNNGEAITTFEDTYYSWAEVTDSRGICPTGFHVPTDAEWNSMVSFYGGLSAIDPIVINFQPLTSGYFDSGAGIVFLNGWAYHWSTTESAGASGWSWQFKSGEAVVRSAYNKSHGLCVRCLKN